jgi:hypothetical protein
MLAEADAGFVGNTLRIGLERTKKLLDLLRDLLIPVPDGRTRSDVICFRLHSQPTRKRTPPFANATILARRCRRVLFGGKR